MRDAVETIEYRGYTIKIYPDEELSNPRTEFDHLGTLVCWHRRYNLGDEQPGGDPDDFLRTLAAGHVPFDTENLAMETVWKILDRHYLFLPLYLYDHGGITISTGPFSCPWDSGQVGWAYISHADIRKEYGVKCVRHCYRDHNGKNRGKAIDVAKALLKSEVEEYDDFLTGNVYGYVVKDKDGESLDSCWGFFGDVKYAISEAKSAADGKITAIRKAHWEQLKAWIRNKVGLQHRTPCLA